jgi:UDP-N-acetylglucosamine 2-epimerase (non-hydrolysing)
MINKRPVVGVVFGTRPEAIKLAPVIFELKKRSQEFEPLIIATSQHRQMLDQVMSVFGIQADVDLDLMQPNQSLNSITRRILEAMDEVLEASRPDCLMIQGDTTTAFAASLAAFYRRIPVAHVEAGLRSRDLMNPWPEEANRRLAGVVTGLHLAPTPLARQNLMDECVPPENVVVTGNTVVDAVEMLLEKNVLERPLPAGIPDDGSRIILITSHRRESWGTELENICGAICDLVETFDDVRVIYPVHLNPNVRTTVLAHLSNIDRVHLIPPVDYFEFLSLLRRCYLVLTDSGGVQEEAPTFHKPVLVLRKVTERPEASMMGLARIVGTGREEIVHHASKLLGNAFAYDVMTRGSNPYGDGCASERIADTLSRWTCGEFPLLEEWQQFQGTTEIEQAAA